MENIRWKVKPIYNLIKYFYSEGELSIRMIAEIFEVNKTTVYWWLKKVGIKTRTISEAKKGMTSWNKGGTLPKITKEKISTSMRDENNSQWKGGGTPYYHRQARRIWKEYWKKEIPSGHLIHHEDKDITNNNIHNLTLVTTHRHAVIHKRGQYKRRRSR